MITCTSSTQVFEWISQFINFEKGQNGKEFTLDCIKTLAELADHPEKSAPVIHIAGSKGKGSVTAYITGILEEAGFKSARYTSPHVKDWRERIALGGVFFDEDDYCKAGEELFSITERFISRNGGADKPTFFELMTLYFFLCARMARCNVMVVETGMGGRLDATNIVDPLLSVITLIEKEHTEYLGNTLALIAGEKAGIIKQGHPVVLAEQKKEAYDVFRQRASEKSSRLYYLPDITRIQNIKISVTGTSFILDSGLLSMPLDLSVPTPGIVQAQNAALAVLAVNASFPDVEPEAVTRGLAKTALRSRFEKIRDDPVVIADGAHTDASVAACADTWTALYGKGGVLLFGCAADKNVPAIASILCPLFSRIIITAPGTFKVSFPEKIYAVFAEIAKIEGETAFLPAEKLQCIPETGLAIERALSLGRENELPVLVTGSFYLAGEISSLGNH